jgi:tetratricopeptide (TPR) repeat protein
MTFDRVRFRVAPAACAIRLVLFAALFAFGCGGHGPSRTDPAAGTELAQAGQLYADRRYQESLLLYDKILAGEPKSAKALLGRGVVLYKLGRYDESIKTLSRLLSQDKTHAAAYYNRGLAKARLEKYREAAADFEITVALRPDFAQAENNLGLVYFSMHDTDSALVHFDRAATLMADAPYEPLFNKAAVLQARQEYEKALPIYDYLVAMRPNDANSLNNRGYIRLMRGEDAEAAADFTRALAVAEDRDVFFNRAIALSRMGKRSEAVADYARAVAIDPKFVKGWRNMGLLRLRLEDAGGCADLARACELGACDGIEDMRRQGTCP